ncbi:hypothetical protein Dthio_PD1900 [Desulfonatronospira thiodismutans ASO3-1]|uniref:Uncharacterized protein n=1 Tax=Desulfonatronospira thiodismutans ASO3-1 TaxID=555779 RepID=D6SP54_9BACT|nr:hypothetical protein Dthio_PD1900 [Desulfonatronospira thiodismutans ASO3-1]
MPERVRCERYIQKMIMALLFNLRLIVRGAGLQDAKCAGRTAPT